MGVEKCGGRPFVPAHAPEMDAFNGKFDAPFPQDDAIEIPIPQRGGFWENRFLNNNTKKHFFG